jgi:hypothetical protein
MKLDWPTVVLVALVLVAAVTTGILAPADRLEEIAGLAARPGLLKGGE